MQDADEDGYGADLTLTCCLEIEMFDNTNGDWEGAQVELELGENIQYFSLEEGREAISSFCLTEEERLNVNFISGEWDSEVRFIIRDPDGTEMYDSGFAPFEGLISAICLFQ